MSGNQDKIVYVHLGTHKTGTTSFQACIRKKSAALGNLGLLVPISGTICEESGHHNIAWQLSGDNRFVPQSGDLDALTEEIRTSGYAKAIISSEDFEYLVDVHGGFERLESKFSSIGWKIVYIIAFRDQKSYAWSLYRELRKHDYRQPYGRFLQNILLNGVVEHKTIWHFHFDYHRYLTRFRRISSCPIEVLSYNSLKNNNDLIDAILRIIVDDPHPEDISRDVQRLNIGERLQQAPLEALLEQLLNARFSVSNLRLSLKFHINL